MLKRKAQFLFYVKSARYEIIPIKNINYTYAQGHVIHYMVM